MSAMGDLAKVRRLTGLGDEEATALLADHDGSCERAVCAYGRGEGRATGGPTQTMLSQFLETTSESSVPDRKTAPVDQEAFAAYRSAIRHQTTPPHALRDPLPRPTISLTGAAAAIDLTPHEAWRSAPIAFKTSQDNVTLIRPTENSETDITRIKASHEAGQCVLVVVHAEGSARTRCRMNPPLSPGETRRGCIAADGAVHTMSDVTFAAELARFKEYQAHGADALLISPTYDLSSTLFFLDDMREAGITIPCIPTVPVINDAAWVLARCRAGKMRVPRAVVSQLEKVRCDAEMDLYGTALASSMTKQLFQRGVANVCLSVPASTTPNQIASVLLGCGLARKGED